VMPSSLLCRLANSLVSLCIQFSSLRCSWVQVSGVAQDLLVISVRYDITARGESKGYSSCAHLLYSTSFTL
jgi:hypothetical protein